MSDSDFQKTEKSGDVQRDYPLPVRKKPVQVEAWPLHGDERDDAIEFWFTGHGFTTFRWPIGGGLDILTLEGTMHADWGDWIIRGVQGEFYPCKPDIFAQTYQEVLPDVYL